MQVSTPDYYPDREETLSPEAVESTLSPQSNAERSLLATPLLNTHSTPRDPFPERTRSMEDYSAESAIEDPNLSVEVRYDFQMLTNLFHCWLMPFHTALRKLDCIKICTGHTFDFEPGTIESRPQHIPLASLCRLIQAYLLPSQRSR